MKKLVTVAEPALQNRTDMFLERFKEKVRSHQEWDDTEDQPEKKKRGNDDHKKNGGSKEKPHGCARSATHHGQAA